MSMVKTIDFDFYTAEAIADPYTLFEQCHRRGSVFWSDRMQGWAVFGFDDVKTVMSDSGKRFAMLSPDLDWFDAPNMIMVDGEYHKRLRIGLVRYFTKRAISKWERRVGEVVEELLAPLEKGAGSYDLIADFTKIPTIIVCDMLGVSPERYDDFQRWSHVITTEVTFAGESPEAEAHLKQVADEINGYVREEMARHRQLQPDDLFTAMLNLPEEVALTDEEIISTAVLLMLGGYETTAKTMGNVLLALEAHPDQRREVANDLALMPAVIEEAQRWNGSNQYPMPRKAVRDTTLDGELIRDDDTLFALMGAANRDPDRWEDPNRFDIHRPPIQHLGFGWGPHLCLGAHLARLETRVAVEHLLKIAPEYRLEDIDLGPTFFIRGPEAGAIAIC